MSESDSGIQEIYGIPVEMLRRLVECVKEYDKVEEIILYGSRAKGTARRFSDIDLTLKGECLTQLDLFEIAERIDDLYLPYEIDLSLYSQLDHQPLLDEIARYGKTLYRRG